LFSDKLLTKEIKTSIVTKMMGYEISYHFSKALILTGGHCNVYKEHGKRRY
jgi:hypothetical protein